MSNRRRARAGTVFFMFGAFCLFGAVVTGYMSYLESGKWHRLHEQGTKVIGVVSEKHVIESGPDTDGDTSTYRRVFFLPAPSLRPDEAELWSETSVATRYPDSVTLFSDWGNRLWSDYASGDYAALVLGQDVQILINGKESLVFVADGPPRQGWVVCGVAAAISLLLFVLGFLRRRRASLPASHETVWERHNANNS